MQLTDSAALVTGAASGLGAATARSLAAAGATVVGLDLAAGWERAGQPAAGTEGLTAISGDVREEASVREALGAVAECGRPLRVAVNCAGIGNPSRILSKRGTHPLDLFERVVSINLIGTFNVLRLAAEHMAGLDPVDDDGQRGLIVNTASVAAFDGQIGQIAYSASKGGVAAMTLPAARDLAQYGIRVMCIAPGILDTPMMAGVTDEFRAELIKNVPFPHRLGRPAEYANLVLSFVAQHYLNGEVVRLDGSLRMPPR